MDCEQLDVIAIDNRRRRPQFVIDCVYLRICEMDSPNVCIGVIACGRERVQRH